MAPIDRHHSSPGSSGEETDDSGQRRRKWAPRVRTGCVTCRHRKVKCDEAKPHCNKCIKARRTCYYHFLGEGTALAVRHSSEASSSASPIVKQQYQAVPLHADMLHADWHFVECMQFYVTVVLPHVEHSQLIPSMHHEAGASEGSNPCADGIIAFTLAARIKDISQCRGTGLIPSDAFGTAHLWDRFSFRVQRTLREINNDVKLGARSGSNKIFNKIHALVGAELMLQSPGWKAHMAGFFAFLQICGGTDYMYRTTRGSKVTIHDIVCQAAIANTVSRPSDNIAALWSLTKDEIMVIYKYMTHPGLNCPSELFSSLLDLTQLRLQKHRGAPVGDFIRPIARNVFTNITHFEPSKWQELFFLPDAPEVAVIATVFQISVAMYGLFTLPVGNVELPCGCRSKTELRDKLFELIKQLWDASGCRFTLNWPIAVLGFSLKEDGSEADQELILGWLTHLAKDITATQPSIIATKLRIFWASGLSEWEDCWQEPFVVIA